MARGGLTANTENTMSYDNRNDKTLYPDWSRFTEKQRQALDLLARGGARYGTRINEMRELKAMGLCYAHDKGKGFGVGRWVWRPTQAAVEVNQRIHAQAKARHESIHSGLTTKESHHAE